VTDQEDIQPWYRHFYVWLVIALLGFAVCASLFTVYLAHSTAEPVLPEYLERQ